MRCLFFFAALLFRRITLILSAKILFSIFYRGDDKMMIRCLMLALTLTLITLSAAYLARDTQIQQVLRQTKVAVESSSRSSAENMSFVQAESAVISESSSNLSQPSEPPRFIADEPIESKPASSAESSAVPAPMIDPSTETRLYPIESDEEYIPTPPTEEQKLSAAEPFVKELFELTEKSSEELKTIINSAVYDYLSADPSQRGSYVNTLVEKYTPTVLELESRSDQQAEAILLKMTAALTAIGADDGLVNDARAAYEYTKQQQTEHYTELLSSFSVQ